MMNKILCLAFGSLFISSSPLLAQEQIGVVLTTLGTLSNTDDSGKKEELKAGSPIFNDQTIAIDEASKAQFRLSDGTLLSAGDGTSFKISGYSFKAANSDTLKMDISKGTVKLLSGEIDRENTTGIRIFTPEGEISVLGTVLTVTVTDLGTSIGFFLGTGFIKNGSATRYLGQYSGYDFAFMPRGRSSVIQVLLGAPTALAALEKFVPGLTKANLSAILNPLKLAAPVTRFTVSEIKALRIKSLNQGSFPWNKMLQLKDRQTDLFYDNLCKRIR